MSPRSRGFSVTRRRARRWASTPTSCPPPDRRRSPRSTSGSSGRSRSVIGASRFCVARQPNGNRRGFEQCKKARMLQAFSGAGGGNRTRDSCLEGKGITTMQRPRRTWWAGLDSNQRSAFARQVYSLVPLTARPPTHKSADQGTMRCARSPRHGDELALSHAPFTQPSFFSTTIEIGVGGHLGEERQVWSDPESSQSRRRVLLRS